MKDIIRIGGQTTDSGTDLSSLVAIKFEGVNVAREGASVFQLIPGHGCTVIAQRELAYKDNATPCAFDSHLCICGYALISSLNEVGAS